MKYSGKQFIDLDLASASEGEQIRTISRKCNVSREVVKEFFKDLKKGDKFAVSADEYWKYFKTEYKGNVMKICDDIKEHYESEDGETLSPEAKKLKQKKQILELQKEIKELSPKKESSIKKELQEKKEILALQKEIKDLSPEEENYMSRFLDRYSTYADILEKREKIQSIMDKLEERRKSKEPMRRVGRWLLKKIS